jgi:hypothetical protein
MDVGAEKLAFIRGGVPGATPQTSPTETSTAPISELTELDEVQVEQPKQLSTPIELQAVVETSVESDNRERRRQRSRSRGAANSTREEPMMSTANLLVPLTTRLSPSTAAALKRAGLEQKLYGRQPGTVQEIAEEAIVEWLREQGYL